MSELKNVRNADFRWRLLMHVSVLALLGPICGTASATASDDDSDRPVIWIELGGQLERQTGFGDAFLPPFVTENPSAPAYKDFSFNPERGAGFSNGFNGKVSFEPSSSDWVFSATVLYGRSSRNAAPSHVTPGHHLHNRFIGATYGFTPGGYPTTHIYCCKILDHIGYTHAYANMQAKTDQTHAIVDFQVGRDFGLGMFGRGGSGVLSAGIRFAQFSAGSKSTIHASPDVKFIKHYLTYQGSVFSGYRVSVHKFQATQSSARDFHGVGPAISWNGSAPLFGNLQKGGIGLDWGANAAVLFGRQHAAGKHQTAGFASYHYVTSHYHQSGQFNRRRTVTIPNVGGFAGVSFRYANAKVSFGYRGDFFFGAMDAGNDTKKTETVGFYGPFASIGIGFGG